MSCYSAQITVGDRDVMLQCTNHRLRWRCHATVHKSQVEVEMSCYSAQITVGGGDVMFSAQITDHSWRWRLTRRHATGHKSHLKVKMSFYISQITVGGGDVMRHFTDHSWRWRCHATVHKSQLEVETSCYSAQITVGGGDVMLQCTNNSWSGDFMLQCANHSWRWRCHATVHKSQLEVEMSCYSAQITVEGEDVMLQCTNHSWRWRCHATVHKSQLENQRCQIQDVDLENCMKLVDDLLSEKHQSYIWPFYQPVDQTALGLYDYFEIVKKPMDLSTIKNNLECCLYKSVDEFSDDMRFLYQNCNLYSEPDTEIYKMAKS
ncbi:unnamed protein product [Mytilus edulis]|uniref:Bromo domain-containing protein n=1 Tax=Mytilus edulis TaxID=6550 RepID=A0A8S3UTT5_MYTED|nr:unnamed protein product [Mytilus edulis]